MAEALRQTLAIFAVAQHLQQPIGQREQKKTHQQRTVEQIHEEGFILNVGGAVSFALDWGAPKAHQTAFPYNFLMLKISCRRFLGGRPSATKALGRAILGLLALSVGALAAKEFVMPVEQPARTYPANDTHADEKVAVAVDPYDLEDKASIFTVNYRNNGYLPVFFVITNDRNEPLSLVNMKAQLNTKDRSKLYPATMDDLLRRLSHPSRNDGQVTLPIPLPKKEVKGGVNKKTWDELDRAQFAAKAVEPHSSVRGFLFFDVEDIPHPLAGASFYLTGVEDSKGNELMYFEIPMEKYLVAPQAEKR
jgi:hypothetical protein